jgi:hypothetical protein
MPRREQKRSQFEEQLQWGKKEEFVAFLSIKNVFGNTILSKKVTQYL